MNFPLVLRSRTAAVVLAAVAGCLTDLARAQVEWVDPTIGNVGILLKPTRPTVQIPNQMIRVYPMQPDRLADQVRAFPLTIISHRLGELFSIMPADSVPNAADWDAPRAIDQEVITPYQYNARLDDSLIGIGFTTAAQAAMFEFTYPGGTQKVLLGTRNPGELKVEGGNAVSGIERFKDMAAYFYGEFSVPVSTEKIGGSDKAMMAVTPKEPAQTINFRYGISFISVEQAKANLKRDIGDRDFATVSEAGKAVWNKVLGRIKVEGGTDRQKRVFYTSLYRCFERMINITEDGRYYSAFDHQVHEDPRPFYVDNWIWDLYQTLEPLQSILNPGMEADQLSSYVRMYEQSGWMPSFAVLWGDHACMNGNHAAPWFADAWFKGIRNYDMEKAFEGLKKNALEATLLPWRNGPKTQLDDFYAAHGYFPSLKNGEKEFEPKVDDNELRQSVAITLENSFDDWCIAQLAGQLKKPQDRELFMKRAAFYKNVFRVEKGFMWPKDSEGNWIEDIDPKVGRGRGGRVDFDENNVYTYNWSVRHDWKGLFELMGGPKKAEEKLDQLFREDAGRPKWAYYSLYPDSTGLTGQFVMGNEPSFPIPYLYMLTGSPWKTQKRVRMLLETWFPDSYFGIPGDEDGGGITSWVVFTMMGFYPLVPGVPAYVLGSPVFDRVTISLENGRTIEIVAKNNSSLNKYIQSFTLNGQPRTKLWFRHADIVNGAKLEIGMGNTPNKTLGTAEADLPPSSMLFDPARLE